MTRSPIEVSSPAHQPGRARLRGAARPAAAAVALLALAAFVAVRVWSPLGQLPSPGDAVEDFITLSLSVFVESMPFVVLGIVVSILIRVWLPDGALLDHLPRNGFVRRAVISLLGSVLPVCECGNVPVARGFLLRGFTVADAVTFLLAAPVINPITIVTTYQAFGWSDGILVARVAGAFLIANVVGWVLSLHPAQRSLLTASFDESCRVEAHEPHGGGFAARLRASGGVFRSETAAMMLPLAAGSAVAGAIQVFVPRQALVDLGAQPVWSVFALMLLAFVVSICSNVDAFFMLGFSGLFLPGGIVAFLVFGAMIDVKMLALLRTTFRPRGLVLIVALVTGMSLAIGLVMNHG